MAEKDGQEKTEQPTQKKLQDARKDGQVAKSMEVNSFALFTFGLLLIIALQGMMGEYISKLSRHIFSHLSFLDINQRLLRDYISDGYIFYVLVLGPVFGGLVIIALAASFAQIGLKFSLKAIKPKFSKLNPAKGLKEKLFSSRTAVELVKTIAKLMLVGIFVYVILSALISQTTMLMDLAIVEIVDFLSDSAASFLIKIALAFAIIAAADFAFQKYKFKQDMMMTKQEIKEENKQSEGSPEIKSRIKKEQFQAARRRMMKELPEADVVITNPTHFAVALKYKMGSDGAPKVIAKGVDTLAFKIREIAEKHNIPIHEDPPLARALYKMCDIGDDIPEELFKAVAKILAFIFRKRNAKRKSIV